jgi:hypothetical protein
MSQIQAAQKLGLSGERRVRDNIDHDMIPIPSDRGQFRRLKFGE